MIVGDEIYKAKAHAKAVKLAELLGMPVTQARQLYANFPRDASAVGRRPSGRRRSGRCLRRRTPTSSSTSATSSSTTARRRSCRAARSSSTCASTPPAWATSCSPRCRWSPTSAYGLDDLIAAVGQLMTPALKQKAAERAEQVRGYVENAKKLRAQHRQQPGLGPEPADRRPGDLGGRASSPIRTPSSSTRPARWRCIRSASTRSAGASCSTTTAPISARASAPRRASSWRGRTSR